MLALVSREKDCPPAARLDEETRRRYLETYRGPIRQIAESNGNPMALYLLSLDSGSTNLLRRAADAGNIQAENAWGSFVFSRAVAGGASRRGASSGAGVALPRNVGGVAAFVALWRGSVGL